MAVRTKISALLSSTTAVLFSVFSRRKPKPTAEDYRRIDFKTSTQRMGVRFTNRIRDVFRFKWLRKSRSETQNARNIK